MQDVNRRKFMGLAVAGTAALAVVPTLGIEGCSTSWIAVAEKDLPVVVNIAEVVAGIVTSLTGTAALSPVILAAIQEASNVFSAAMQALQDAIAAYQAAPSSTTLGKVVSAIDAVEADAPKVIQSIAQAPGNIVSIVTSAIGTAITLLSAIESLIPSAAPATVAAKRVQITTKAKLPDSQTVKSNFNAVLVRYGYANKQVS